MKIISLKEMVQEISYEYSKDYVLGLNAKKFHKEKLSFKIYQELSKTNKEKMSILEKLNQDFIIIIFNTLEEIINFQSSFKDIINLYNCELYSYQDGNHI